MDKYVKIKQFLGYITASDKTKTPTGALVEGSQNVIVKMVYSLGKFFSELSIRGGYSLYGAQNTDLYPVESAYDWETSSNAVRNLRCLNDEVQFYDTIAEAWTTLKTSFTAVDFSFAPWWDTSEQIDLLLFVNGADNLYDWSGAVVELASATTNTLTKTGTTTWANERFLTTGTRKVVINGTEYTYTGGEGTTTLTGVTGDPTGEAVGSTVFQAVRTNTSWPTANYKADFISTLNNQVWAGSNSFREVYVSTNTDYTSFTIGSPRIEGAGELLVFDSLPKGFMQRQGKMLIFAGKSDVYAHSFKKITVSTTLTEVSEIKTLKLSAGHGAQSQDFISGDYYLSYEPSLRQVIGIDDNDNLITANLSTDIQPDFDAETFTGGHLKTFQNRVYLSAPTNDNVYINEAVENSQGQVVMRFWQAPQILPVRKFAIISNKLYGHSNAVPETYKLFDGTSDGFIEADFDNKRSVKAVANLAYNNYGNDNLKTFSEILVEGYISTNTELLIRNKYDYGGVRQKLEKIISGSDDDILFQPPVGGQLGDEPLETLPLGDLLEAQGNPKFKQGVLFAPLPFHEHQICFESDSIDQDWTLLEISVNVKLSPIKATSMKK